MSLVKSYPSKSSPTTHDPSSDIPGFVDTPRVHPLPQPVLRSSFSPHRDSATSESSDTLEQVKAYAKANPVAAAVGVVVSGLILRKIVRILS